MPWFAHSLPGRPEEKWETQREHSEAVWKIAFHCAEKFGFGDVAAVAGILHDLGKYNPQFQDYIRQKATSPDHSSAGAAYARQAFDPILGALLAHCIAGHHTGLQDKRLTPGERLAGYAPKLPPIVAAAKADGFKFPAKPAGGDMVVIEEDYGFQFAFLTRMLFSCLVYADHLATEAFYSRAEGTEVERAFTAKPADLALELASFMAAEAARREAEGEASSDINLLRARVLDHVAAQAKRPRGVFTLTVPTGGGKTLTSIRFALDHAREHKLDRVIVVIPFTSVIEQTAGVYRRALARYEDQILEHHSAFEDEGEKKRQGRSKLELATETWDAPLVVTTAVQFFESLFASKASRCRKLHNLARSVVVLDEAQTMPLHLLRPCVAALKELSRNYGSSIVLCTATQPALEENPEDRRRRPQDRRSLIGGFIKPHELAPDPPALFRALDRVRISNIGTQDDTALAAHMTEAHQALCIVNSRAHARELYDLLAKQKVVGLRHLSTLMLPGHRRQALDEIKADLKAGRPCRVVSTSLVEAGVDFSFALVLRAEAGLEQIVQAAGRCNRNGKLGEGRYGEVLVFVAEGRKPLAALVANVEVGREIMRHHENPQLPDAIQAYYGMLYHRRTPADLDRHGILEICAGKADSLDFPFETIAKAMRLIDDVMEPVIVPLDDEARKAVAALRHVDKPGALARVLQRHTIGVPPSARKVLTKEPERAAEFIRRDVFGDQFVVLANLDLYRTDVGLTWNDPTFIEAIKYPI